MSIRAQKVYSPKESRFRIKLVITKMLSLQERPALNPFCWSATKYYKAMIEAYLAIKKDLFQINDLHC